MKQMLALKEVLNGVEHIFENLVNFEKIVNEIGVAEILGWREVDRD